MNNYMKYDENFWEIESWETHQKNLLISNILGAVEGYEGDIEERIDEITPHHIETAWQMTNIEFDEAEIAGLVQEAFEVTV